VAEYVNVHGQPLGVSARMVVLMAAGSARCDRTLDPMIVGGWVVRDGTGKLIGTGASEESAWRAAWSRILAEEVKRG
jgi:hypothetical protein